MLVRRLSHPTLIARQVVARTLASLPTNIRTAAEQCPIDLVDMRQERRADPTLEEDLLGLFEGASRMDADADSLETMPRIRLFLDNLWDYAEGELIAYREEVRITLLHELGHYLGLDEQEVEALGLA